MTILAAVDLASTQSDFDGSLEHALSAYAPFAYRLAAPVSDPVDPATIPRLGTHDTTTVHTSCDSLEWCTSFHADG